jgi:hypothetical protein
MLKVTIVILLFLSIQVNAAKFDTIRFFKMIDSICLFPEIVKAQAILETSWFTSDLCRNRNNYFGMMRFNTRKYQYYINWKQSVQAYSNWQKRRLKEAKWVKTGNDYLLILDKKYCWEVKYSYRVKKLMKSKKFKLITK